ncbi:MAG: stage sporulation protein [Haloplasmataceae bacterium]|jgi:stage II sporulation protein R|nr:stage sporulation protein [Haloplasmataceae bacterium]
MRRGITILIFFFAVLISIQDKMNFVQSNSNDIPQEAIRLRILANSNEEIDQEIKNKVRDEVINVIYPLVEKTEDYNEARTVVFENLELIKKAVEKVLEENNLEEDYYVNYGVTNFPDKIYADKLYPAGKYEAVYIVLGDGQGDNWWCVLFPPLCLLDVAVDGDVEVTEENYEIEYKFLIVEKIKKLFGYKN